MCEFHGDAADFLDRPADEERCAARRGIVFGWWHGVGLMIDGRHHGKAPTSISIDATAIHDPPNHGHPWIRKSTQITTEVLAKLT
jgi:hypothetical protein